MNAAAPIAEQLGRPVDDPRRGGRLKIFAREDGARVRFVSDDIVVREAELIEVAFFDQQAEADAVALACADILTLSGCTAPDQYGWHLLPEGADAKSFIATLLVTARTQAWSRAPAMTPDEDAIARPLPALRASRRRWSHGDDVYFALLVGQGHSAKGIAAELGLTVMNVYKHANRLGLSLVDRHNHETRLRLPADVLARIDSLAETGNMRRETFLSRWVTKAARGDPGRYGMVLIS